MNTQTTMPAKSILFIDSNVADYQSLMNGVRPGIEIVLLDGVEDGAQVRLALACGREPVKQCQRREGLEQVAVQGRFGGLGHGCVGGFGGDHEEHRREGQQLGAAKVIEQRLSGGLGVVEVMVAQHIVEHRVCQPDARVLHPAALNHFGDPVIPQLGRQQAAGGDIAVHHQGQGV